MNKIIYSCSILLIMVFGSCSPKKESTTLKVKLSSLAADTLSLYSMEKDIYLELYEGHDSINIDITEPTLFIVGNKKSLHRKSYKTRYVHLNPNEHSVLDTTVIKNLVLPSFFGDLMLPVVKVNDKVSEESRTLNDYTLEHLSMDYNALNKLNRMEPDSFRIKIQEFNAPLKSFLSKLEQNTAIDNGFKSELKNRILSDIARPYIGYARGYAYHHNKLPSLSADFYEEVAAVDFKTQSNLSFKETLAQGKDWITKDLRYKDFESAEGYYDAYFKALEGTYKGTALWEYYLYDYIIQDVNNNRGIDANQDRITSFNNECQNDVLKNFLTSRLAPWNRLRSGLQAPRFLGSYTDGTDFEMDTLKDKITYIDVWATWCVPCIAEIPALKELEKSLADKERIQFLSISIDNLRKKQKWLDFVDKYDLGGIQLLAENGGKSEIKDNYNISGIPRFMILGPNGTIVNSNAPRPSDPQTKTILSDLEKSMAN